MGLSYCLMRQNWHEFGDFLLLAEALGCEVFVNTVIDPSHCSLYTLPPEELAGIAEEMEKQSSSLQGRLHLNQQVWENSIHNLRNNANKRQAKRLTETLKVWQSGPEGIWDHLTSARELVDKGRYAEALEEALKMPETDANYYHALFLCGHIRRLLGDLDGAETDLDRALKMSQRRPEAFIYRAWVRLDQNRLEEALGDALRGRELIRDLMEDRKKLEGEACEVLGVLYIRQGMLSEALSELDRLLDLQPQSPRVRVQRGWAFLSAGLRERAVAEAEAALALEPTNAEAVKLKQEL